MTTFNDLRKINVSEFTEKKGNLSYLSWAWAVDTLLQHDPMATWEFPEPTYFGETMMVYCSVTAFGKTMKMHLPVMDNRNNAVKSPDSRKVSDAMMRCLAKCIACFGIGLYIYAGEDLPVEPEPSEDELGELTTKIESSTSVDELVEIFTVTKAKYAKHPNIVATVRDLCGARKNELLSTEAEVK